MYHNFFGLSEQAFSIAVNPRYLYMSDQHREALAHLVYGIQVGGFVLLTGEVGTGKTTIIRCLLEQLPDDTDIAIVLNPMASAPELLSIICDELGVSYVADKITNKNLIDALHEYLLQSHMQGRKTVLLIDEAQLLKPAVLEQIRLLTNLETTTEKLLQIILVGQPELKNLLARPSLRQLSQRITARFHLEALSLAETQAYISHRLAIAGMPSQQNPFPAAVVKKVHEFSGGVPRLINILCERMLLGAYSKNQSVVDRAVFQQAATEVSGQQPESSTRYSLPYWQMGLIAGLIILLFGSFILGRNTRVQPMPIIDVPVNAVVVPAETSPQAPALALNDQEKIEEVPEVTSPPVFWVRDATLAQQTLYRYLELDSSIDPCAGGAEFSCEKARLNTWNELQDINRPAVLTLITADKKLAYTTLVGLSDAHALVLIADQPVAVEWQSVASMWNGEVRYLWRRPPGFERPIMVGERGPLAAWLAQQFAVLDKQAAPLTRDTFNQVMKKRVEIFQANQQLEPDGIVGAQTLRRLNEALGIDKTLVDADTPLSDLPAVGVE